MISLSTRTPSPQESQRPRKMIVPLAVRMYITPSMRVSTVPPQVHMSLHPYSSIIAPPLGASFLNAQHFWWKYRALSRIGMPSIGFSHATQVGILLFLTSYVDSDTEAHDPRPYAQVFVTRMAVHVRALPKHSARRAQNQLDHLHPLTHLVCCFHSCSFLQIGQYTVLSIVHLLKEQVGRVEVGI